jgi:hypothetical protein
MSNGNGGNGNGGPPQCNSSDPRKEAARDLRIQEAHVA